MTDPKHTPGPWEFKTAANGDNGILAEGTGVFAEAFAEIRHGGENARDEALANARLIAAAPDLLAALKALRLQALQSTVNDRANEWGMEALGLARCAISKAEGTVLTPVEELA